MAENQKLALEVTQTGAAATAEAIGKVETANKKVAGTAVESAAATDVATEATKKAAASNEDLFNILNKIHPGLGEIAQTMSRGSKVAGDFATKNIDLKGAFDGIGKSIVANAGAFKLLLAGGAVAAGIALIGAAVAKMRAEFEAATKAIADNAKALDELRSKQIEEKASIEQIADARKKVGAPSAEEASRAASDAEAISGRLPELGSGSVRRAAGVTAGLGLERDKIEQLAILLDRRPNFKLDGDQDAKGINRQIDKGIRENADFIASFRRRETAQVPEAVDRARRQAVAAGGETNELRGFASTRVNPGTDLDRLAGLAQKFGSIEALEDAIRNSATGGRDGPFLGGTELKTLDKGALGGTETVFVNAKDIADLREVLGDLTRELRKGGGGTTHIAHQTNYAADAAAQKRRERNGASVIGAAR